MSWRSRRSIRYWNVHEVREIQDTHIFYHLDIQDLPEVPNLLDLSDLPELHDMLDVKDFSDSLNNPVLLDFLDLLNFSNLLEGPKHQEVWEVWKIK